MKRSTSFSITLNCAALGVRLAPLALREEIDRLCVGSRAQLGPAPASAVATKGVREYFLSWLGAFTDRRWEIDELTPLAGDILVIGREHLRGKGSGLLTQRRTAVVHTIRHGKMVRSRLYGELSSEELKALRGQQS